MRPSRPVMIWRSWRLVAGSRAVAVPGRTRRDGRCLGDGARLGRIRGFRRHILPVAQPLAHLQSKALRVGLTGSGSTPVLAAAPGCAPALGPSGLNPRLSRLSLSEIGPQPSGGFAPGPASAVDRPSRLQFAALHLVPPASGLRLSQEQAYPWLATC